MIVVPCYSHQTGSPVRRTQAGCPSGQWERTVNPSAEAYTGSNPVPATFGQAPSLRGPDVFPLDLLSQIVTTCGQLAVIDASGPARAERTRRGHMAMADG